MSIPLLVLCGGKGLRIRGNFQGIPKPLIPVRGKPIVSYIIEHYLAYGVSEVILLVGENEDLFHDFVTSTTYPDCSIRVLQTGLDTPTGGRLVQALPFVTASGAVFATYGDGLSDVDLNALLAQHKSSSRLVTLTAVYPNLPFGLLEIGDGGEVSSFIEKPRMCQPTNGGFFVISTSALEEFSADSDFEVDVLPDLVRRGKLGAYVHQGFWKSMDTYKDYVEMNSLSMPFFCA